MKLSIVYYSETGNTERIAGFIAAGASSIADTEVRTFNLKNENEVDIDFINNSKAVIVGTPTYVANTCWQIKKWFDTGWDYKLAGKLGAVFATENSPNGGGAEIAMLTVINHMLVKGMLVYSSGVEFGKPTIHIGPAVIKDDIDKKEKLCTIFGQRIALKAHDLFDK